MKLNRKTKLIIALAINVVILIMELIGIVRCANELLGFKGLFLYYTEDSNMFLTLTALGSIVFIILELFFNKKAPRLFKILKYSSVCTVLETFLVVVFVLGFTFPTNEKGQSGHYQMLFVGSMLFHHFLCPVISCLSFLLFEGDDNDKLTLKEAFYAFIPTIIYGVIILFLNIIKVVVGPYPFLHIYEQTIWEDIFWVFAILGCAFAITIVVGFLYNKINKKIDKKGL